MREAGIIFDCDGTLVDSLTQALESFNYALDRLGEPPRSPEVIKRYFGAAADRILLGVLGDEEKAHRAFEYYLDHQSELAKTTRLHEGVIELLDALAEDEVPMGIVTGRHARDLDVLLKPHSLASYFQVLVADSELPRSKPAPDGILQAAKVMGLRPDRTFYVGDSHTDMQASHNAGSIPVAALWDQLAKREELKREKPAFFASRPMDVRVFFHERFG